MSGITLQADMGNELLAAGVQTLLLLDGDASGTSSTQPSVAVICTEDCLLDLDDVAWLLSSLAIQPAPGFSTVTNAIGDGAIGG